MTCVNQLLLLCLISIRWACLVDIAAIQRSPTLARGLQKFELNGHASESSTPFEWRHLHLFQPRGRFGELIKTIRVPRHLTSGVHMFPTIAANLFDFYFPNDRSIAPVAPRGALLDTLSKPWSVQQIHEAGEAAMMRLLQNGHKKSLKLLWAQLDDRAWLEKIEARHRREFYEWRLGAPLTDLHVVIASSDAGKICRINDGDIQTADIGGALILAAVEGSNALIDALLSHGTPIQTADKRGRTSAHIAAAAGNQSGLEALLRHGADARAVDHHGATPLMLAVGAMSASCAELLLPISDLNARDLDGADAKNYAPAFHADPDDPGFENALRYARLLRSLEEASNLEKACGAAAPAKSRWL